MNESGGNPRRVRFRVKPEVRIAVAKLNRSQNEVARHCALTSGYLSQLLTGMRFPGPAVRQRLMDELGWTFDELFEEVAL